MASDNFLEEINSLGDVNDIKPLGGTFHSVYKLDPVIILPGNIHHRSSCFSVMGPFSGR